MAKSKFHFLILILLYSLFSSALSATPLQDPEIEQALINSLLSNYSVNTRPLPYLAYYLSVRIKHIEALDERTQTMTSTLDLRLGWRDPRLAFNATQFNTTLSLNIPLKNLWRPDTYLSNTINRIGNLPVDELSLAAVNKDGFVYAEFPLVSVKTLCSINVQKFPFDEQKCRLEFSSWAQSGLRFILPMNFKIQFTSGTKNSQWQLSAVNAKQFYGDAKQPFENYLFSGLAFELSLARRPTLVLVNVVAPCFFINFMTLILYFLPFGHQMGVGEANSNKKNNKFQDYFYFYLGLGCFLLFIINWMRIAGQIPTQSDEIPLILYYFIASCAYIVVSMLWFVINNNFRMSGKMLDCLMRFADVLDRVSVIGKKAKNDADKDKENNLGNSFDDRLNLNQKPVYRKRVDYFNRFIMVVVTLSMIVFSTIIWIVIIN